MWKQGSFRPPFRSLPEGSYRIVAQHHGHRQENRLTAIAGATNTVLVEFAYGAAAFETEPPGARVLSDGDRDWGTTPLTLPELPPGTWKFALRKDGYESALISMEITANETNTFRTDLVNASYAGSVNAARRFIAAGDFDRAVEAAREALQIKPNDTVATRLESEAAGRGHIRRAETFGKQGNQAAAIEELKSALNTLPDDGEANELLTDFTKRQAEQAEERRLERLHRPKVVYDSILAKFKHTNLFESHEMKTSRPARSVAAAISDALEKRAPVFKIRENVSPPMDAFLIDAEQKMYSGLIENGARRCVIVVGQTSDNETQILFKVFEYTAKHKLGVQGLLNFRETTELIPIDSSRSGEMTDKLQTQLKEGVVIVAERIQAAIGPAQTQ